MPEMPERTGDTEKLLVEGKNLFNAISGGKKRLEEINEELKKLDKSTEAYQKKLIERQTVADEVLDYEIRRGELIKKVSEMPIGMRPKSNEKTVLQKLKKSAYGDINANTRKDTLLKEKRMASNTEVAKRVRAEVWERVRKGESIYITTRKIITAIDKEKGKETKKAMSAYTDSMYDDKQTEYTMDDCLADIRSIAKTYLNSMETNIGNKTALLSDERNKEKLFEELDETISLISHVFEEIKRSL